MGAERGERSRDIYLGLKFRLWVILWVKKFIFLLCFTILAMVNADNGGRFTKDPKGVSYLGEVSGSLEAVTYSLLISLLEAVFPTCFCFASMSPY